MNLGPDGPPMESGEADAVEQQLPVAGDSDEAILAPPWESDIADANEQQQIVVTDDEEYPR